MDKILVQDGWNRKDAKAAKEVSFKLSAPRSL